jgi:hypothetical protein
MIVNQLPSRVRVYVPRTELADLVPALANEPTLYGCELVLEVSVDGEQVAAETWTETLYDQESDRARWSPMADAPNLLG